MSEASDTGTVFWYRLLAPISGKCITGIMHEKVVVKQQSLTQKSGFSTPLKKVGTRPPLKKWVLDPLTKVGSRPHSKSGLSTPLTEVGSPPPHKKWVIDPHKKWVKRVMVTYENMQTIVSSTIFALLRSVAVMSMKMFFVFNVIFV